MKPKLPIYNIKHFRETVLHTDFYANHFIPHIKHHHIIAEPHKHDFYLVVLFTRGSGTHEIDFNTYAIKPGTVFLMRPGQMHHWNLSDDIDGFVFFHDGDFYDKGYTISSVLDYPFFNSISNPPLVLLKKKAFEHLKSIFKEIVDEYQSNEHMKYEKIHTLVSLIYIELSRHYMPITNIQKKTYLLKLRELEQYIDVNFKTKKYPHEYAALMHISEKHLNRICKECLNKTTSQMIAERIIVEAKRLLIHKHHTVSEISSLLGYDDNSYFTRFFKKNCGETPIHFLKTYLHESI